MGKIVECKVEKHIFPKFSLFFDQKWLNKERNLCFVREEIILFRSNLGLTAGHGL
jgi:hypothetical protein